MRRVFDGRLLASLPLAAALVAGAAGIGVRAPGPAKQPQASGSDVEVVQLRPNFYVVGGAGGNIAVQVGPAGMVLVDTGTAQMADKALAAIDRLSAGKIRYIINTSADADHVGGNEILAKAGKSILGLQGTSGVSEDVFTNGGAAS